MTDRYRTVEFDGSDVCSELGCRITLDGFEMDPPSVVESYVDIPGRIDGPIDMSEALTGYPTYGTREMKVTFFALADGRANGESLLTRAFGMLHGRRGEIVLSWDPDYTYFGRISIEAVTRHRKVVGFTMTAKCEPYKLKQHVSVTRNVAGGVWLELESGDAPVCPEWTIRQKTEIHKEGSNITYQLGRGRYRMPDLVLRKGTNRVYAYARGTGGTATTIGDFASDAISDLEGYIGDWLWEEGDKPTGGSITVEYDWKDL